MTTYDTYGAALTTSDVTQGVDAEVLPVGFNYTLSRAYLLANFGARNPAYAAIFTSGYVSNAGLYPAPIEAPDATVWAVPVPEPENPASAFDPAVVPPIPNIAEPQATPEV